MKSDIDIKDDVYNIISSSKLKTAVNGSLCKRERPFYGTSTIGMEDICISVLANQTSQIQSAYVNVNIYVQDKAVTKNGNTQKEENPEENIEDMKYGSIVVIENVFHYKQVIPLRMGDNVIGRYQKGNPINCPIETVDPSIDMTHCTINVSRDKKGNLKYILRDGPSYTGTFVDNEILGDREKRVISNGTLFTIGATSIILKTNEEEE